MQRQLRLFLLYTLFCVLLLWDGQAVTARQQANPAFTTSDATEQMRVQLTATGTPRLGQPQMLTVAVTPLLDAPDLHLRWVLPPGVTLVDGPGEELLGAVAAGTTISRTRTMRMDAAGLHRIGVAATYADGAAAQYGAAAILFFRVDAQGGAVTDSDPQALAELDARIPLGADAAVRAATTDQPAQRAGASICVDVMGRVTRIDKVLTTSSSIGATDVVIPVTHARVQLWEADPIFDDHENSVTPDANGNFFFAICTNDGWFDDELEFYIKVVAETEGAPGESIAEVRYFRPGPNNTHQVLTHAFRSAEMDIDDPGTLDFGTLHLNETMSGAINIVESIYAAWRFWNDNDSNPKRTEYDDVVVYWLPGRQIGSGSHYEPIGNDIYINGSAADPDQFDDSTIIHEWTHFADDKWGCDDNPGGSHTVTAKVSARLAWGEGYPDFYQSVVRTALGQPRGEWYVDLNGLGACGVCVNLESWHTTNPGHRTTRNEMSIAAALWDLIDTANDDQDQVTIPGGYPFIEKVFLDSNFADSSISYCAFEQYLQIWKFLGGPTDAPVAAAITQNTNLAQVFRSVAAADAQQTAITATADDSYRWWARVAYLVDTSASMAGARLSAVKTVLQEQVDTLFQRAPKGVEFSLDTFTNGTPRNQTLFTGQFYPTLIKPTLAGLTTTTAPDTPCAVDAFGALQQAVAGSTDLNAWLFTDNYPSATVTPLETLRAQLVARNIKASFAVLLDKAAGACSSPAYLARQQQLQRQLTANAGLAPTEPASSLVPYLLTALATGGQFLFVDEGQMAAAAQILQAQLNHTAGAGRWSDYVSTQPTYRHDRLASWDYQWIDAEALGKPLPHWPGGLNTEDDVDVVLPAPFLFYGRAVTITHVYENGYLTFGQERGESFDNSPLPNPAAPNGALYPYWDNLEWDRVEFAPSAVTGERGAIYTAQVGDWFVIQYDQYASMTADDFTEVFEVLLNLKSGEIRYQYHTIANGVGSATIGLESWSAFNPLSGVLVAHNSANAAASGMGYRFVPVPPQPSKRYTVTIDSTMPSIGFLLTGYDGTLAPITVRTPDGGAVVCNSNGVLCVNVGLVQYVQVDVNGRTGRWTVEVQPGASGSGTFALSTIAAGALTATSLDDRTRPVAEEQHLVIDLGQPVDGHQLTGQFRTPGDRPFGLPMLFFDDGAHADGAAGDGRFGSVPFRVGPSGTAYLWVTGNLNGQPFHRVEPKPFSFQPLQLQGPATVASVQAKTVIPFTLANQDNVAHTFRIEVQTPLDWRSQIELAGGMTVSVGVGQVIPVPVAVWMGATDQAALDQPSGATGAVNVAAIETEQGTLYDSTTVQVTRQRPPAAIELYDPRPLRQVNSSSTLRLRVVDSQEFPVADGTALALSSTLGALPTTVTTQFGLAEVTFSAGNQPGVATLRAQSANGISATAISTITLPMADRLALTTTATTLPADGQATAAVIATVLDTTGAPLANQTVQIGIEGGGDLSGSNEAGTLNGREVISGTTDGAGAFQVTFTSGSSFGQVGLRAELLQAGVPTAADRRTLMLTATNVVYLPLVQR